MPARPRSEGPHWHRSLKFKTELLIRDPLGMEILDWIWAPILPAGEDAVWDRCERNLRKLVVKYNCGVFLAERDEWESLRQLPREEAAHRALRAAVIQVPYSMRVSWDPTATHLDDDPNRRPASLTYTFQVNVTQVTHRNLEELARRFTLGLKKALKTAPPWTPPTPEPLWRRNLRVHRTVLEKVDVLLAAEGGPATKYLARLRLEEMERAGVDLLAFSGITDDVESLEDEVLQQREGHGWVLGPRATFLAPEPQELAFLRTVNEVKFVEDLRRYDLHMRHGMSFRLIAALEALERVRKQLPEGVRNLRVRHKVKGESGVQDSVQRLYLAIHRKPYRARRRRLDSPAQGIEAYHCPHHPPDTCPSTCAYLKDWMGRAIPTLPSDQTGRAPHEVALPRDVPDRRTMTGLGTIDTD